MKIFSSISKSLVAVAMLFGTVSASFAQKMSVEPLTVAPGEEATFTLDYETETSYSSFLIDVILPEGLSYVEIEDFDADGEPYKAHAKRGTALLASHNYIELMKDEAQKHIRIMVDHGTLKNMKNSGSLLEFKVLADENLADNSEIVITNIQLSGVDENMHQIDAQLSDVVVPVIKGTPTGINGIEANSENAASFNLAGQKVSANAKGIRIQNGKKVVVK